MNLCQNKETASATWSQAGGFDGEPWESAAGGELFWGKPYTRVTLAIVLTRVAAFIA